MDNFKENTLKSHVQLCELRYKALETRLDNVEAKLIKLEADVSGLKTSTQQGFSEIKLLLEQRNTSKQTQILASAATIIVALIGFLGYILVRS